MSACFILSLDCEGKWGVSDHLAPRHHAQLSDDRLHAAYKDIFAVLDRYEIAATFAITGFFGMSRRELLALPYGDIMRRLPYTKNAFHDILDGSKQGWSAEWLHSELNIRHERALHGISHTPYNMMDSDTAKFELSLMPVQAGQTFVFPRNAISHVDILQREIAIIGYRQARPSNRFSRLIDELNIFEASEQQQPSSGPVRIPAGYFVNWKSGVRKLVPTEVSRARAVHILDHAIATNGVAHFWSHPENIAAAPKTLSVLDVILSEVASRRDAGKISVLTQLQYSNNMARRVIG